MSEEAERISGVCYYRTDILSCGTAEEERAKAQKYAEREARRLAGGDKPDNPAAGIAAGSTA